MRHTNYHPLVIWALSICLSSGCNWLRSDSEETATTDKKSAAANEDKVVSDAEQIELAAQAFAKAFQELSEVQTPPKIGENAGEAEKAAAAQATKIYEEKMQSQQVAFGVLTAALEGRMEPSAKSRMIGLLSAWGTPNDPVDVAQGDTWGLDFNRWQRIRVAAHKIRSWHIYPAAGNAWFDTTHRSQVKQTLDHWDFVLGELDPNVVRTTFCTDPEFGLAVANENEARVLQVLDCYTFVANVVANENLETLFEELTGGSESESKEALESLRQLWHQIQDMRNVKGDEPQLGCFNYDAISQTEVTYAAP